MSLYRDQGVVVRTLRLGEADRIVTVVTRSHGKVRAVAKGIRRTRSRFGARLEPMSHVALLCWQGRGDLDVVTQAEVIDTFRAVREDLDRMAQAGAMLEVVDQVSQERHADVGLYEMTVRALRALALGGPELLVPAFFWKVLALEGAGPMLDACAMCGAESDLVAMDPAEGGVLCRSCRRGAALRADSLALLRRILGGDLAGALAEPAGPATRQVAELASAAMEVHLERRLRSGTGMRRLDRV